MRSGHEFKATWANWAAVLGFYGLILGILFGLQKAGAVRFESRLMGIGSIYSLPMFGLILLFILGAIATFLWRAPTKEGITLEELGRRSLRAVPTHQRTSKPFVEPQTPFTKLLETLATGSLPYLIVMENNQPKGIVTTQVVLSRLYEHLRLNNGQVDLAGIKAEECIDSDFVPLACSSDKLDHVLKMMVENRLTEIVVLDNSGRYLGMVHLADLLADFIPQQGR